MVRKAKNRIESTNLNRRPKSPVGFVRWLRKEPNELKKKTLFTGFVFDKLARQGVDSYLVGGEAVELYTAGQFATGDIDITVSDKSKAERLLLQMDFKREGMIWLNENLGIAVQIVASYPTRTEKARTIEVAGLKVKIEGVEDLIVDRLVSAKYWRSNPKLDMEQAAVLLGNFKQSLDLNYIRKRASEENVEDYYDEILRLNRNPKSRKSKSR